MNFYEDLMGSGTGVYVNIQDKIPKDGLKNSLKQHDLGLISFWGSGIYGFGMEFS